MALENAVFVHCGGGTISHHQHQNLRIDPMQEDDEVVTSTTDKRHIELVQLVHEFPWVCALQTKSQLDTLRLSDTFPAEAPLTQGLIRMMPSQ
jgi:hypothetical protein